MKTLILGLCLVVVGVAAHADSASIDSAKTAAADFLSMVDEREYEKSYSEASAVLRDEVSQEDWAAHLSDLRDPLGKLHGRSQSSSEYHESLPDAPPGEYVIFTFDSAYENNKLVAEVVAVAKGDDGVWRVVGYYFG